MTIIANETYHIYNQGNNQEKVFYNDTDYIQFLTLFKRFVLPNGKVLAYCLMPNHFHFLIHATDESAKLKPAGNISLCELSNGFRLLQSNYAQYFNKRNNRSGSLFRQKTKAKNLSEGDQNYGFTAFQYIHQNPFKAGLVTKIENWIYSSFIDYLGLRKGTICDQQLAFELIGFNKENFLEEAYAVLDENLKVKIF
jgi:REP element-mobilizing transposase RayT